MITTAARKHYETVAKMTDLELAKIEANEMHPLYDVACAEIDARLKGLHAIDTEPSFYDLA